MMDSANPALHGAILPFAIDNKRTALRPWARLTIWVGREQRERE